MTNDPRELIDRSPMSRWQISVITLCILLVSLDGFDVLSISFASPGIAKEWGIDRAALGIVLSMELIGMGLGAFTLGHMADRIGRRPIILLSLVIMTIGMYLASIASSVTILSVVRLFTGVGIGGILASVNAMVAEFSNARSRSLSVSLMAAGYPMGVIIGGSIASVLLANYEWRSVFLFGAILTLVFIPIAWVLMPESISYLVYKRPANALQRINRTLGRMGHETIGTLAVPSDKPAHTHLARLFKPDMIRITLSLTIAYFTHIMTFYYIIKWIPKLVVDMGYSPALSGSVLVWANVGGVLGAVLFGLLTRRYPLRNLVVGSLLLATVMVAIFGVGHSTLIELSLVAGIAGLFTNAAIVGMYALFAQSFPTEVRAGGTGFVVGIGRGGAVMGPVIAGFLFESGQGGLLMVSIIMATGSLIAAAALFVMPYLTAMASNEAAQVTNNL
ncbi:MAG: MFS transporter [Candidatus Thiodiazotropha sp.]|jgi:benzoate transport